jgi:hypothetical protein
MFASVDSDIAGIKRFMDKALATEKGKLAIQIWEKAVDLSPVYSGSYRASWQISIGALSFKYDNSSRQPNSIPRPSIPSITLAGKAMDKVYVSNGAPYSFLVEYGGPKNPAHHVAYRAVSASI